MQIIQKPPADLIPYVNNAKIHSDNQISKIASSIKEFGFKTIPQYKKYEISKSCVVRNKKTLHILKPKLTNGYLSVGLYDEFKKIKYHNIHRLAAMTWLETPLNYHELHVAHNDGNSFNNFIDNLSWKTAKENIQDKYLHNSFNSPCGENHHNHRLTKEIVASARMLARNGKNCKQISEYFGIPKITIYDAVVGKTWKSVKEPFVNLSGRQYVKSTRLK